MNRSRASGTRCGSVFGRFCISFQENNFLKLNLLPNEPIESFWDALWLGIRLFLCSDGRMAKNSVATPTGDREFNLIQKEPIESF